MENKKLVKETLEELLQKLDVKAEVKVEEKEGVFEVQMETEDTGVLIGYHGETLASLQLILSLMIYKARQRLSSGEGAPASKKTEDSWLKILVNIGDWRQRREETLKQMALSAAEKVVSSGEAMALTELSSFERRTVHLALADHPQVTTESEGEGSDRRLIIKLK